MSFKTTLVGVVAILGATGAMASMLPNKDFVAMFNGLIDTAGDAYTGSSVTVAFYPGPVGSQQGSVCYTVPAPVPVTTNGQPSTIAYTGGCKTIGSMSITPINTACWGSAAVNANLTYAGAGTALVAVAPATQPTVNGTACTAPGTFTVTSQALMMHKK